MLFVHMASLGEPGVILRSSNFQISYLFWYGIYFGAPFKKFSETGTILIVFFPPKKLLIILVLHRITSAVFYGPSESM